MYVVRRSVGGWMSSEGAAIKLCGKPAVRAGKPALTEADLERLGICYCRARAAGLCNSPVDLYTGGAPDLRTSSASGIIAAMCGRSSTIWAGVASARSDEPASETSNRSAWRRVHWPAIKKALQEGPTILFIDESGISQRPHRVRTCSPRGETPVLQYNFNWDTLSAVEGSLSIVSTSGCIRVR